MLSPAYFDVAKSGELISRLTADTTQIKAAVGASVSIALRNVVLFVGAAVMMVVTSPRLSAFVLATIPVIVLPLYGFGRAVRRRSRAAQDTLAAASGYASELIGATRVLQAFTNETLARSRFGAAVEQAFLAARASIRARAILTAIAIFLVFASVVVVLWIGAQDVLAARISAGDSPSSSSTPSWPPPDLGSSRRCGVKSRRHPAQRSGCSRSACAPCDPGAGAADFTAAIAAGRGLVRGCPLLLSRPPDGLGAGGRFV